MEPRFDVLTGSAALDALAQPSFATAWAELHACCPWATVFQGPEFVGIWYRTYAPVMVPLVLCEWQEGRLSGLLTLALAMDGSGPVVAGLLQAEYQCWLVPTRDDPSFIVRALEWCRQNHPRRALRFQYLPPDAPLEHLRGSTSLGLLTTVSEHRRPLMQIDPSAVAASLKKKSNKSRFNRLKRTGEVKMERLTEESAFAAVLDEIIWQYDLRQGAINHSTPFLEDPYKRQFHLELMRHSNILHTTVLRAGDALVAAHINYRNRDHLCLGIPSHSPFHAEHSPGKLHMMLLAQELAQEGITLLDLTPGDDEWKERFATAHDTVYEATIHPSRSARTQRRLTIRARAMAKSAVMRVGLQPDQLRQGVRRAIEAGTSVVTGGRSKRRAGEAELVWIRRKANGSHPTLDVEHVHRNRPADLLLLGPDEELHARHLLLSSTLTRLETGQSLYTYVRDGRLLAHAWLVVDTTEGRGAGEAPGQAEQVVLRDFAVRSDAGDGDAIEREMLKQMLHDASTVDQKEAVVHVSGSRPSRHVLESLGFAPVPE